MKLEPGPTGPESQSGVMSSSVDVCGWPPWFVQLTVSPTLIMTLSGAKKKSSMSTLIVASSPAVRGAAGSAVNTPGSHRATSSRPGAVVSMANTTVATTAPATQAPPRPSPTRRPTRPRMNASSA